jgi:hypothetical protein
VIEREIVVNGIGTGKRTVIQLYLVDGREAELLPPASDLAAVVGARRARNPGSRLIG